MLSYQAPLQGGKAGETAASHELGAGRGRERWGGRGKVGISRA